MRRAAGDPPAGIRGAIVVAAVLIAALALSATTPAVGAGRSWTPVFSGNGPAGGELDGMMAAAGRPKPAGADDWMYFQKFGGRRPSRTAYTRALAQARSVARMTAAEAPDIAKAEWTHLGPTNLGGRVVDLAVDPSDNSTVYAASASGGVWKSTDMGVTFSRAWPDNITQSLGALAIGQDGTLYAGTGEPNPGGGSIVYGGAGIYRSTDGGKTWKQSGLRHSGAIGRIVIDPSNPKRVFVAAAGDLFTPGGERGVYRSTDGGKTWTKVLAGANATTGAVDLAIDPQNPKNILAGMWDHRRFPTHRVYAGPGSGVYRSADGGNSWTRTKVTLSDPKQNGRIGVAFAPSDPSRAYAIIANKQDGTVGGLFRSDDGGKKWTQTGAGSDMTQSSYGWWFGRIWVDPQVPDRLFVAGLEVVESVDGGENFVAQSNSLAGVVTGAFHVGPLVHADQHAMVWDPSNPARVYLGNDGGVYRSEARGVAETWVAAARQGWTQHYSVDVSEQNPSRVVSGMQDNMCQRNYLGGDLGRPDTWTKYGLCGDGLQTLINPEDDRVVYGCAQYGANCSKTLDGGVAFTFLGDMPSSRFGWWAPLQFDPSDPQVMYAAGNVVSRSTDGGNSFKAISPDLSTNPKQLDPNPGYRIYGTVTTVATAKSNPKVIYAGTDEGLLWKTSDQGKTWKRVDDALPDIWVTRVAIDPRNENVVYATFSGFRNGSSAPHVVRSTNGGKTWTDISGNLPDAPVNEIILIGGVVAVGTDVGVFLRKLPAPWFRLGGNLPMVPVQDLRYHEGTKTLTAATFGHGIQRVAFP